MEVGRPFISAARTRAPDSTKRPAAAVVELNLAACYFVAGPTPRLPVRGSERDDLRRGALWLSSCLRGSRSWFQVGARVNLAERGGSRVIDEDLSATRNLTAASQASLAQIRDPVVHEYLSGSAVNAPERRQHRKLNGIASRLGVGLRRRRRVR